MSRRISVIKEDRVVYVIVYNNGYPWICFVNCSVVYSCICILFCAICMFVVCCVLCVGCTAHFVCVRV
jgi:hypothetical protein